MTEANMKVVERALDLAKWGQERESLARDLRQADYLASITPQTPEEHLLARTICQCIRHHVASRSPTKTDERRAEHYEVKDKSVGKLMSLVGYRTGGEILNRLNVEF